MTRYVLQVYTEMNFNACHINCGFESVVDTSANNIQIIDIAFAIGDYLRAKHLPRRILAEM